MCKVCVWDIIVGGATKQATWLVKRARKQQQRVDKGVEKFCAVCFKKGDRQSGRVQQCSPVGSFFNDRL